MENIQTPCGETNNDVAGWGVVAAVLCSSTFSILISVVCLVLLVLNGQNGFHPQSRRFKLYRAVSVFLLDLSITQIVTGFALYVSAMKFYSISWEPHALIAVRLSELSAVSQIQIVLVAHIPQQLSFHLRWLSSLLYGCAATLWNIILVIVTETDRFATLAGFLFLFVLQLVLIAWTLAYIYLRSQQKLSAPEITMFKMRAVSNRTARFLCFTEKIAMRWPFEWPGFRMLGFAVTLSANIYLTYLVCELKFYPREWQGQMCSLTNDSDDRTTFGQILAVMMMASMVYSFIESGLAVLLLRLAWPFLVRLRRGGRPGPEMDLPRDRKCSDVSSQKSSLDDDEPEDEKSSLVSKPPAAYVRKFSWASGPYEKDAWQTTVLIGM